jgi:hypothetical protein
MRKRIDTEYLRSIGACRDAVTEFEQREADRLTTLSILRLLIKEKRWDWFAWFAPRLMTHKQKVQWAIFCAEQVINIYEKKYPSDDRPRKAIDAAKACLKNPSEKTKRAAAYAANAAYAAANAAAYAANAAAYAAYAANAAAYAAYAAAYAANAAAYAAYAANAAAYAREGIRLVCAKKAIAILLGRK